MTWPLDPAWALYPVLILIVAAALWTVQAHILRAVIGLAAVSVLLTVLMFQMGAPLAGVFELSVCAGLITVVFVSTISLTRPLTREQEEQQAVCRARRFHPAILLAISVAALFWIGSYELDLAPAVSESPGEVGEVLWGPRRLDLLGQAVVILAGVFGVVVLFKRRAVAGQEGQR